MSFASWLDSLPASWLARGLAVCTSLITLSAASAPSATASTAATTAPTTATAVRVSLIKTAQAPVREAMLLEDGRWLQTHMLNHIAVLVEHPKGSLMFDAGLSTQIEAEQQQDMNWFHRHWPLLAVQNLNPARKQLPATYTPDRIVLSHVHWDHASGTVDFPQTEVWASPDEIRFAETGKPPAVLPSQVRGRTPQWHPIAFANRPVCGFARSHDVYGDGRVLLVDMPGHTPGSVGLFLTTGRGRKLFFVGDTVWRKDAVIHNRAKPWMSRTADIDREQTAQNITRLRACIQQQPDVELVPAHDDGVQDALGYYPHWID